MEDGTETHQAEINKNIKANDKLRKILTNMPEEHTTLIYGDSLKSKMESLDDEKAALLAAKRQFLPLRSRIDSQKNYLERVSKEIESKQKKRLEILQKWIEADQELEAANAKQIQAKQEMALLVAEQSAENAKLSIKGIQGFSLACQDPSLISSCTTHRSLSAQIRSLDAKKAWGATVFRNSSWRLEQPRRMSRTSARLWHRLRGHWRQGSRIPGPGPEAHSLQCEVVGSDEEFSNGICIPGFSKMDTEGQEAIKRSLSNALTEKRRLAEKCKQEGEGL